MAKFRKMVSTLQTIIDAEPGDQIVYDKFPGENFTAKDEAREAYERGFCELVQKRNANGHLEYLAIRRKTVRLPKFATC